MRGRCKYPGCNTPRRSGKVLCGSHQDRLNFHMLFTGDSEEQSMKLLCSLTQKENNNGTTN